MVKFLKRIKRVAGATLAAVVIAGVCSDGFAAPKKKGGIKPLDVPGEMKLNLPFKSTPQGDVVMDVYTPPKGDSPTPVVLYTHGGGWATGSHKGVGNASFRKVFTALGKEGFCVVSVGYRLVKKNNGVQMRDCVIDSKDALRYMSKHAEKFNIDPQRCYVMGDSAGGHIAQMVLLSPPDSLKGDEDLAQYSYKMVAGVSWYGPCDFEKSSLFNHDDREKFRDRFGPRILLPSTPKEDKLKLYREMSPINYVTADSAPLLMIQGDGDTTIPVKHAYHMQEKLKEVEAPIEIVIVKNAGHNWREATPGTKIKPWRGAIEKMTVDFIKSHN